MKRLVKNNIKFIIGVITGIMCCSLTVYASYQYIANEVSYTPSDKNWKVASVEEALDELYNNYHKDSDKGYGVRRRLDAISSEWERIGASKGLEAHAQIGTVTIQNDFDDIYPWSDIISYNYNTDTKEIIAYYGEDNFSFNPEGNVEVLTKIPEFYYRRYQDNEYEYIYISKDKKEGYTKSEEFSVGRYTMSGNSTRVHSKSGYSPLVNTTITNFRTYARNLGEEFGQMDYYYFILQLLYLVEYADYNSQAKIGLGYTGTHTGPTKSGGCDILGMKSGSVDGTDNSSIIYRGIEDIFGNVWQLIDGINVQDYQAYVCYNQNEYQSDKYDGCYQRVGYVNASIKVNWASKLGYDASNSLINFPIEANGSATTHITNYYHSATGNYIVQAGGSWGGTLQNGLFDYAINNNSFAERPSVGARLIKNGWLYQTVDK